MKNFVTSERAVFKMDKSAEPAITVKDGSVVKIKTKDYFNGQIQNKQLQYGDLIGNNFHQLLDQSISKKLEVEIY